MAAPRPKKKTIIKKKAPAKKVPIKKTDVKSPEETRKSISRKQVGTSRPAKDFNKGGLRAKVLQDAAKSAASRTILRTGLKVAGPVGALVSMTVPAGEGSTVPGQAQKAVEKKMKREIRQGPELAVTGVKEGIIGRTGSLKNKTGQSRPEYRTWQTWKNKGKKASVSPTTGSRKPAPGSNYSGQEKKKIPMKPAPGSNYSGKSSTYSGYGTFNTSKIKTNATNTAATSTAAASSGGESQAATVAKAGGSATNVSKTKVGRQTRYQRDELAMEQKRSSSRPKKSIFSLFRKG